MSVLRLSRAAEIIPGGKSARLQVTVDPHTQWVIQNLRGSAGMGTSDGSVVATIIDRWMVANRDELREMGLWPPEISAGKAVVVPPGA